MPFVSGEIPTTKCQLKGCKFPSPNRHQWNYGAIWECPRCGEQYVWMKYLEDYDDGDPEECFDWVFPEEVEGLSAKTKKLADKPPEPWPTDRGNYRKAMKKYEEDLKTWNERYGES